MIVSADNASALFVPALSGIGAPPVDVGDQEGLPAFYSSQTAREIVTPEDLILAIRNGDIALRMDGPAPAGEPRAPWLFDEEHGTFDAPPTEQLTIVLDNEADDGVTQVGDGLAPPPTVEVLPDQSWLGAIGMALLEPARSWWRR